MLTDEAKRFKSFRRYLKMTQKEFEDELGVTQSEISKFERGERPVPDEVLKKLHLKFKYSYQWHFHGEGKMITGEFDKRDTITDVKSLKTDMEVMSHKLNKLEKILKQIVRDFYDLSNQTKGHSGDTAGTKMN